MFTSSMFCFLKFKSVSNAFIMVILVCLHLRQHLKLVLLNINLSRNVFLIEFCCSWLCSSIWFLKASLQEVTLGKLELKKKCTKANVNFLFDSNLGGSVGVQYYDVIEGICLRNTDFFFFSFLQNSPVYTHITVAGLWWKVLLTNNY